MAILRSLLVNLGLNSSQYRQDLKNTQRETKSGFSAMQASVKGYVASLAAAVTAATTMAVNNSKAVREMSNFATISGIAYDEMVKLDAIGKQVGLTAEQMSDQFKDVRERVGEFVTTGGGTMQDFFDVMKMNEDAARRFAKEMIGLSGQDVIRRMVTEMEAAGKSTQQMSFAVEGMANDMTKLLPLLLNSGEEFERISGNAEKVAKVMTKEDIDNYRKFAENIDTIGLSFDQVQTSLIAKMLPALNTVTEKIRDFFNEIARGIQQKPLKDTQSEMVEIGKKIDAMTGKYAAALAIQKKMADGEKPTSPQEAAAWAALAENADMYRKEILRLQDAYDQLKGKSEELELTISPKISAPISSSIKDELEMTRISILNSNEDWAEYYLALEERADESAKKRKKISEEAANAERATMQSVLSGVQMFNESIMSTLDEQSGAYKAMFLVQQATAFAQAMVAANLAYSQVLAHDSGILGLGAVATAELVRGLGYASAGMIAGQAIAGVFHGGGAVPGGDHESTYLLKGGEYVESRAERREIDKLIAANRGGGGMNVTVDLRGTTGDKALDEKLKQSALSAYRMVINDARSNGPAYKAMKA